MSRSIHANSVRIWDSLLLHTVTYNFTPAHYNNKNKNLTWPRIHLLFIINILTDAITPKASACIFITENRRGKTQIKVTLYSPSLPVGQTRHCPTLKHAI